MQPETLIARNLMSQVLNCPEHQLEMSDGEVGIPSLGITNIRCRREHIIYYLE